MAFLWMAAHLEGNKCLEVVVAICLPLLLTSLVPALAKQEQLGKLLKEERELPVQVHLAIEEPLWKVVHAMAWALVAFLALELEVAHPPWEVEGPNLEPNPNAVLGVQGFCSGTNLKDGTQRSRWAHRLEHRCGLLRWDGS